MQRKLKGVADPDQEPLGGPSREQSPLERGSNGAAAASDPLEAGGGGAAPQAGQPGAAAGGGGGGGGGGGMFGGGGGGGGGGATAPRRQRARGRLVRSVVFEDGSRCECVPLCEQAPPISPLYLPHTSPKSPLYLHYISTVSRRAVRAGGHVLR